MEEFSEVYSNSIKSITLWKNTNIVDREFCFLCNRSKIFDPPFYPVTSLHLYLLQPTYRNLFLLQMEANGNVQIIWERTVIMQIIQSWRPKYKTHFYLE